MRKTIAGMMLATFMTVGLTACGDWPSACEGLSVSDKDREAAANGYEVEKEDDLGNTCELSQDGNTWEVDD